MAEHTLYEASAGWLKTAVERLGASGAETLAPTEVEPGVVDLAAVASAEAIARDYANTRVPLKRVFFPITDVLLEFENRGQGDGDVGEPPPALPREVIVLGCRPCDAAAVAAMDSVFQWDYDDVRYRARRDGTTLVSLACTEPGADCFCTSVGGSPHGTEGSDILVHAQPDGGALLQVLTEKGQRLIERLGDAVRPAEGKSPPAPPETKPRFDPEKIKRWLDGNFESDFWTSSSLRCLGCGACSFLCPTCHCFDIVDEATWNHGQRRRNWDFCSGAQFTLHGSGHNPRPTQAARYRQRIMHKFKYYPERFGRLACVGCGRCIRNCGSGQNLVESLEEIASL